MLLRLRLFGPREPSESEARDRSLYKARVKRERACSPSCSPSGKKARLLGWRRTQRPFSLRGRCMLTAGTQSNGERGPWGVGETACVPRSAGAERDFCAWVAARWGPGKARQLHAHPPCRRSGRGTVVTARVTRGPLGGTEENVSNVAVCVF